MGQNPLILVKSRSRALKIALKWSKWPRVLKIAQNRLEMVKIHGPNQAYCPQNRPKMVKIVPKALEI